MTADQPLSDTGYRDEAGAGRFLDVRGAVYAAEPDRMILVLADATRVHVSGPGLRTILAETGHRVPRLLDGLPGDAPRKQSLCSHLLAVRDPDGTCRACGKDLFRGYGSPRGMREEIARRGIRVPALARLSMLAALLACSGTDPDADPPGGWRLQ
jgi:hypothetical protein